VPLTSEPLVSVLARLHERALVEDPKAAARVQAHEEQGGRRLSPAERYELYGNAPLAISREVGELLYVLTLARRPRSAIEFGSSLGISTIYLAAGLVDCRSGGSLIATEVVAEKAAAALANLREAGLDGVVHMRVGDAVQTLGTIEEPVDSVFLDGRNDLYLPILRLLEPNLTGNALIVADLSTDDPSLADFLAYVRDPANAYASVAIPLDDGVEVAVRLD
jgi:predicted O-methyltransferase YrrM